MADSSGFNASIAGVGLVFRGHEPENRSFLGSCFCFIDPGIFVTAAHCVMHEQEDRLWINHVAGPEPALFTPVREIVAINDVDIALMVTETPQAKWARPFQRVRFAANLGEVVCAFGFTVQSFHVDAPAKETPRFFRGTIQRPFVHTSSAIKGATYSAYELSFPCPSGLSGGPLFLDDDPSTVLGVVTEDIEAGRSAWHVSNDRTDPLVPAPDTYRVVNYGVASNLGGAAEQLETLIGSELPVSHAA